MKSCHQENGTLRNCNNFSDLSNMSEMSEKDDKNVRNVQTRRRSDFDYPKRGVGALYIQSKSLRLHSRTYKCD